MSQIQQISIQLAGIGSVLKSHRFKVPAYQRSYAWEIENVDAILSDLNDAIKNKEKEYFLGSIVVTASDDNRYEVVDGQQRLTTVSLLIAAIKDIFSDWNDYEAVSSVKSDFLSNTDRKTKEKESKLILNEIDNEPYQELIENISKIDASRFNRQSHTRLISAARHIYGYLQNLCQNSKDEENELHTWLDYVESNMKIIVVIAPDDSNAFTIFETLNDRGLELAISDLLKNYLFHRSNDKIEETKNRWLSMVAILESTSDDPLIVTYLRHFSMARYGLIREKELFGAIKRRITSKKAALQFSTELAESVKIYSALINTDHEYWTAFDHSVKKHVSALNLLGMSQIRPLLLAILDKFNKNKVQESFRLLVSVAVRFQIVGGVGGGTLERLYADTARSIAEEKITKPSEILDAFKNLPTDSAFQAAFQIASISKQSLARYYLRSLENGTPSASAETTPSEDTNKVNLEHVLPITPNKEWESKFNKDEIRSYQKRLGNLAIMSAKANSKIGNDSFEDKRNRYSESGIYFTKMISTEVCWSPQSIERRQTEMAKIAVKVWEIKAR